MIIKDVPRRDSTIYARVSEDNKEWVEQQATNHKLTISLFLDLFLTQYRQNA